MSKTLTREECLSLDLRTYNQAITMQWELDKVEKNLSGELSTCKHCQRKYVVSCICDKGQEDWNNVIEEVKNVSNRDRSNDFS